MTNVALIIRIVCTVAYANIANGVRRARTNELEGFAIPGEGGCLSLR
jgi:hypothetical protein